jgi:hypothetical protein
MMHKADRAGKQARRIMALRLSYPEVEPTLEQKFHFNFSAVNLARMKRRAARAKLIERIGKNRIPAHVDQHNTKALLAFEASQNIARPRTKKVGLLDKLLRRT